MSKKVALFLIFNNIDLAPNHNHNNYHNCYCYHNYNYNYNNFHIVTVTITMTRNKDHRLGLQTSFSTPINHKIYIINHTILTILPHNHY